MAEINITGDNVKDYFSEENLLQLHSDLIEDLKKNDHLGHGEGGAVYEMDLKGDNHYYVYVEFISQYDENKDLVTGLRNIILYTGEMPDRIADKLGNLTDYEDAKIQVNGKQINICRDE